MDLIFFPLNAHSDYDLESANQTSLVELFRPVSTNKSCNPADWEVVLQGELGECLRRCKLQMNIQIHIVILHASTIQMQLSTDEDEQSRTSSTNDSEQTVGNDPSQSEASGSESDTGLSSRRRDKIKRAVNVAAKTAAESVSKGLKVLNDTLRFRCHFPTQV